MVLATPTWIQNGTYSAKEDRAVLDATFTEGVINAAAGTLAGTQRAAGANNSVDVASGVAVIQGDDEFEQGKYLVRNVGAVNVAFNAAPVSNKRIDVLCLRVNDPQASGPSGNDATFTVVEGTVSATPSAPAVPLTAIPICEVLRTTGDTTITTAMITDRRTEASFAPAQFTNARLAGTREPFTVVASAATGTINMDCSSTAAMLYTTNASANWTLNLRASASAALTTIVGVGESLTVTFAAQQGATPYYLSTFQIDGSSVTPKWQDGQVPAATLASVIDVYTFTCIRTGAATWTVLGVRAVFS